MTFQLGSNNSNEDQIIAVLQGLKNAGIIDYFKREQSASEPSAATIKKIDEMMERGEADIREGNVISSEDLLAQIQEKIDKSR